MTGWRDHAAAILSDHGGQLAPSSPGEILAWFGYPEAHEDAAERAANAALLLAEDGARVRLATGLVVAEAGGVIGAVPGEAARPRALAARRARFWQRRRPAPWPAGYSATATGTGRAVLLQGEAGIGKSRLALAEAIAPEPDVLLRYFCSPQQASSPLHPVIAHLTQAAGIMREDGPDARRDKLHILLKATGTAAPDRALIAELLGIAAPATPLSVWSPQRKREEMFHALLRRAAGLAAQQPVLILSKICTGPPPPVRN